MATNVIMPQLGETVAEGKILDWFVAVGDEIKSGDRLFEVETDKVTIEVEAVDAGTITSIAVSAGEVADIGAVVAVLNGESGGDVPVSPPAAQTGSSAASMPTATASVPTPLPSTREISPFAEVQTSPGNHGPASGPDGMRFSPLARRIMSQNGVDASQIASFAASNGLKKVREADVQAFLKQNPAQSGVSNGPATLSNIGSDAGEVITMNTMRARTGQRLAENWRTIPHVFQAIEVDFSSIDAVRSAHKVIFKQQNGFSLTFLPFIARATTIALAAFPEVNGRFEGDRLVLSPGVNLGIAVDLNHNGLVVPVVHGANELTVAGLARAIGRQVDKARTGKLTSNDLSGGTYSITNNGAFGTSFTAPIINAPQSAILSVDAIRLKPAVVETEQGAFIAPRRMGFVGQSFDHRAFDGAYAAAFLSRLKLELETRDWASELQ